MILTIRRQQRVLAAMHSSLGDSDPHLVSTFATFTRWTAGEEIPGIERVRSCPPAWLRSGARPSRWARGMMFIPVAAGLLLVVAILLAANGARVRCPVPRAGNQSTARAVAALRRVPVHDGLACLFPCRRARLLSRTVAGEM